MENEIIVDITTQHAVAAFILLFNKFIMCLDCIFIHLLLLDEGL
ncbi:hypothetical protein ymoll0001_4120 [Yersinia mollaretii ATCC 43969]|uniref:Uncharacterized protein n=1 Tax=Yersinia mollaretii (strain ATCC 43969 / DSM 18520 / CIP 103324 / CNY 7263 / WAIP 204) TaxID=349967 RepID=A0ABM9YD12_YERMW|nr:hypothetical protein ymoll0001_4120 [Yersinia mollaretii ATCC 43969]